MEPMELDEDNVGHHTPSPSHPFLTPRRAQKKTYPIGHSAPPPFSPSLSSYTASRTLPGFSPARALGSGAPWRSASADFGRDRPPFCRSDAYHAGQSSGFTSPVPPYRSFSANQPVSPGFARSPRVQEAVTSRGGGGMSPMETSGASDSSEMEVVQSSPRSLSPSWDAVRLALGSFSLFKKEPEREPGSTAEGPSQGRTQEEVEEEEEEEMLVKGTDKLIRSWEPSLSTVRAAATFKQRRGRKSNVRGSNEFDSPAVAQLLYDEDTDEYFIKPLTGTNNETMGSSNKKSRGCGCGLCACVITLLLAFSLYAFLLQRHDSVRRETFAQVDTELLRNEMASQVFGQHIAVDVVPTAIENYLKKLQKRKEEEKEDDSCMIPPLVLSFHGWTGVGKNFVSDIITGLFSAKTVTRFLVPYHFPHQHLDEVYRSRVAGWILSNVTDYSINFFILDEMDKATPGIVQGVGSAIAKLRQQNSCRSPVVFLFLSNSFGTDINQRVFEATMDGDDRERLSVDHFSSLFDDSGEKHSWYNRLRLHITVTVPFLPLESRHIIQCIRRDLVSKKLSTHTDLVQRVLRELMFTKLPNGGEFSQTGCKRVSDKVDLVAFD